jgi:hypothetical protein
MTYVEDCSWKDIDQIQIFEVNDGKRKNFDS